MSRAQPCTWNRPVATRGRRTASSGPAESTCLAVVVPILAKYRLTASASASGDGLFGRLPAITGRTLRHREPGPPSRTRRPISSRVSRRTADLTCRFPIPVTVRGTERRPPLSHHVLCGFCHQGRCRVTHLYAFHRSQTVYNGHGR